MITSTDGTTWTTRTSGFGSTRINGVAYGNDVWVAVGDIGTVRTSTDGITWTTRTSGTTGSLQRLAFGNGLFVARDNISGALRTSPNGIVWSSTNAIFPTIIGDITYSTNLSSYIVSVQSGVIAFSKDLITWTSRYFNIPIYTTIDDNNVVVTGADSGAIFTSAYSDNLILEPSTVTTVFTELDAVEAS